MLRIRASFALAIVFAAAPQAAHAQRTMDDMILMGACFMDAGLKGSDTYITYWTAWQPIRMTQGYDDFGEYILKAKPGFHATSEIVQRSNVSCRYYDHLRVARRANDDAARGRPCPRTQCAPLEPGPRDLQAAMDSADAYQFRNGGHALRHYPTNYLLKESSGLRITPAPRPNVASSRAGSSGSGSTSGRSEDPEERRQRIMDEAWRRGAEIQRKADKLFDEGKYAEAREVYQSLMMVQYEPYHAHAQQRMNQIDDMRAAQAVDNFFSGLDEFTREWHALLDDAGLARFSGKFLAMETGTVSSATPTAPAPKSVVFGFGGVRIIAWQFRLGYGDVPEHGYNVYDDSWNVDAGTIYLRQKAVTIGGSLGLGLPIGRVAPFFLAGKDWYIPTSTETAPGDFTLKEKPLGEPSASKIVAGVNFKLNRNVGLGFSYNWTTVLAGNLQSTSVESASSPNTMYIDRPARGPFKSSGFGLTFFWGLAPSYY